VSDGGGEACAPSGRQRPGQAAAVVKVLEDVAGTRPGHPSEPLGIVYAPYISDEIGKNGRCFFFDLAKFFKAKYSWTNRKSLVAYLHYQK
jgi:hypothetical protein